MNGVGRIAGPRSPSDEPGRCASAHQSCTAFYRSGAVAKSQRLATPAPAYGFWPGFISRFPVLGPILTGPPIPRDACPPVICSFSGPASPALFSLAESGEPNRQYPSFQHTAPSELR